jgi:DNA polymerase
MIAWAVDDGEPKLWDAKTQKHMPAELRDILHGDDILIAHNAAFEQSVFAADLVGVKIDPKRWRCSMARAYAHGLPGSLDSVGAILGLKQDQKKSKECYDLIRLFCVSPPKNSKRGRATYETHPTQWERFKTYCKQDIVAAREVWKKLPAWNYKGFELDLWHLDQRINQRGICIDTELAEAAIHAVDKTQASLRSRTVDLTLGDVDSATKRDQMLAHILAAYGVELPDMQASTLERRIDDPDLPAGLKELLAIRLMATTSSTAKYKKVMKCVSNDERLRGTLQFCGAARTGRWSGRLFQPQNLARPTLKTGDIEIGIEALKNDCADILYPNVMELASNCIRGVIIAPKGKKLVVSDLSNIEGRDQAWLAGEQWKIKAFEDFDKGEGYDIYVLAYARTFRVTPESVLEDKERGGNQRQVGKVLELALGYHGGVGSFVTFAALYSVDLSKLADKVWDSIPQDVMAEAKRYWDFCVPHYDDVLKRMTPDQTLGLPERIFIACDSIKRMWRRAHPKIVQTWEDIKQASLNALSNKGHTFECGKLKMRRDGNWFRIVLPSGRALCYPHARLDGMQISFMGVDQYTRKWQRIHTYSGKLWENVCQAVARDVMAHGMMVAEKRGYETVLTVHDELICEAPDTDEYREERLSTLLSTQPEWAPGLPLAAGGYQTYRYRKE